MNSCHFWTIIHMTLEMTTILLSFIHLGNWSTVLWASHYLHLNLACSLQIQKFVVSLLVQYFWLFTGHERFGGMTRVYYKYAHGALIVFDLSRPETFESALSWLTDITEKVAKIFMFIIRINLTLEKSVEKSVEAINVADIDCNAYILLKTFHGKIEWQRRFAFCKILS